jgi:hypothetical protein
MSDPITYEETATHAVIRIPRDERQLPACLRFFLGVALKSREWKDDPLEIVPRGWDAAISIHDELPSYVHGEAS